MDTVIAGGDEIVLLAEDDLLIRLAGAARPPVVDQAITTAAPQPRRPERTLLIGWNHRAPKIIDLLDDYVESGSSLDIAAPCEDPRGALPPLARLTIGDTPCDTTDRAQLESLDVGSYKHVIVLSDEDRDPEHADARTLVTLLHLRDMEDRIGDPYSIVSEIHDDESRRSPRPTTSWSATSSSASCSRSSARTGTCSTSSPTCSTPPARRSTSNPPPTTSGPAPPPTSPPSWRRLAAAARPRSATVRASFHTPPSYGVVLNPDKAAPLTLSADDRVIVLAEK